MPNYIVPSPVTWSSGPIRAGLLRSNVSDAVALLSQPPMFIGAQAGGQSIPSNAYTLVNLDTEYYDNANGHRLATSGEYPYYYAGFPGWYLCEASVPVSITASGGYIGAAVGGVQNGGSYINFGGQRIQALTGQTMQPVACKLMSMTQTGYGTGDYITAAVYQYNSAASAQTLVNTVTSFPQLSARWVSALTGTSGLPVPSNPAWPTPTSYVTSAFLNANIRDTIRFLIYPPICEYAGGTGSIASVSTLPTTGTTMVLTSQTVDNYSAYNTSTGVWTAPVAGEYFCYGCAALTTGTSANSVAAGLTVTSSNYNSGTTYTIWGGAGLIPVSTTAAQAVRKRLRLNAGDTVSLAVSQYDASSASDSYGSVPHVPRFITVWQGA